MMIKELNGGHAIGIGLPHREKEINKQRCRAKHEKNVRANLPSCDARGELP